MENYNYIRGIEGMNITKIKVNLTGEDLLSIYSEFVSVEGLEVKDIKINDEISITGRLNKGFNIDFLVNLKFESYEENVIKVEITKIKVLNIGVLKIIKNMAIKYLLKSLKEKGIIYNKGKIEIEYYSSEELERLIELFSGIHE